MTTYSQRLRLLLALAVALVLSVLVPANLAMAASHEGDGVAQFGTCLVSKQHGSIVFLMDQSGSLRQTDPQNDRIVAAKYAAQRLARYATKSGVTLDVRVAGFASTYTPVGQWTALNEQTLPTVEADLVAAGNQIYDYDTDYWLALEGARQDLTDHRADADTCKAIIWFTDGDYDIDPRTDGSSAQLGMEKPYVPGVSITDEASAAAVVARGKEDMCRPTGLADQLRSSGISLFGVGLSATDTEWPFLRSVILGGGDNAETHAVSQCGDIESPPGTFLSASDLDSLYRAFDAITAPGETRIPGEVEVCQGDVCAEGEARFVLDSSIRTVHVMSSTNVPKLNVFLFRPGHDDPVSLDNKKTDSPQTIEDISYRWLTDKTLEIDLDSATQPVWDGVWRIAFVDKGSTSKGEKVTVNVSLSSPMVLEWTNIESATMRSGETVDGVQLQILEGVGGPPVDLSTLKGSVKGRVSLRDSEGASTILFDFLNPAQLEEDVSLKIGDVSLGRATLTTELEISTPKGTMADGAEVGPTVLLPSVVDTPAVVEAPLNFPSIGDAVNFGLLDGTTTATVSLPITGPGCVWLQTSHVTMQAVPGDAGSVSVTSPAESVDSCVRVDEGASGELPLTLTSESAANGMVAGVASVGIAPLDSPEDARAAVVSFEGDMRKPLNVGIAWATFALVFAAGLGVPLLVFYAVKFKSAVFTPESMAWGTTQATIPDDGEGPAEVAPVVAAKMNNENVRGKRTLTLGGYRVKTVTGWSPTSMPRAELVSDSPSVSGMSPGERGGRAQLPLALCGQWVAILDQLDSPRTVTLLVLAISSTDREGIQSIVDEASKELPRAVSGIAGSMKKSVGPDAEDVGDSDAPEESVFGSDIGEREPGRSPFSSDGPFSD